MQCNRNKETCCGDLQQLVGDASDKIILMITLNCLYLFILENTQITKVRKCKQ